MIIKCCNIYLHRKDLNCFEVRYLRNNTSAYKKNDKFDAPFAFQCYTFQFTFLLAVQVTQEFVILI